ncbi:MAG: nicotinate mononucleotide-dependent phosphoribosyltransferase CobT [Microcoleaceae cyanobacterium]
MIRVYTAIDHGDRWLQHYQGKQPRFVCVLGFTETGLIPGISAAGATPADRKYTCIADAEFLYNGPQLRPQYPLPPLQAGASPVLISRAVIEQLTFPVDLFNAGLPVAPAVPVVNLGGVAAECVSSGQALPVKTVQHLFQQGLEWGDRLATKAVGSYLILSECVVGGTTTALAVLLGLGIAAQGKVNSSHPQCNHSQKLAIAITGLHQAGYSVPTLTDSEESSRDLLKMSRIFSVDPLKLVAAVGDPMQAVVAGMTIAASRRVGVLLAGGTQMLAVYQLVQALAAYECLPWQPEQVVVGTTRWVAEDPTGDTVALAQEIRTVPLIATQLSFATSAYPQLQAYEQGFVKEGVGAGGCAIAASLSQGWSQIQLLQTIEALLEHCLGLN